MQAGPPKPAANFAAGAVAAVAATVLTQPTDVLRTRLQLLPAAGAQRMGSFATMAAIMRSQGVRGLWAGTVPRVSSHNLFSKGACFWRVRKRSCRQTYNLMSVLKRAHVKSSSVLMSEDCCCSAMILACSAPNRSNPRNRYAGIAPDIVTLQSEIAWNLTTGRAEAGRASSECQWHVQLMSRQVSSSS